MKVLIVDDDRPLRDALRRTLVLGGYDTIEAADGETALAQVASAAPDAVVLDVGLPDIDGLEVSRRLRASGNRVPPLMLTGRDRSCTRCAGWATCCASREAFGRHRRGADGLVERARAMTLRARIAAAAG